MANRIEPITNQRLSYMDIAKGFGILCVIAGHMDNELINRIVFSFHMPLFFVISGYFLAHKKTPKEFLLNRCKQLLPPYIFTCFCVVILSLFKNGIGYVNGSISLYDALYDSAKWCYASLYGSGAYHEGPIPVIPIGAIWFIPAIIIASFIVKKVENKKNPIIWILIIACLGYFSSRVLWLPWSIQSAMTASVFVYMGVIIKRYKVLEEYSDMVFPVCLVLWINEIIMQNTCVAIVSNQYPNRAFDFIGGGCGAICIILIAKYFEKIIRSPIIIEPVKWLGKNSLTILCMHLIELNIIPWQVFLSSFGFNDHFLLIFLLKLIWAIGCTVIINHTMLKKIFNKG